MSFEPPIYETAGLKWIVLGDFTGMPLELCRVRLVLNGNDLYLVDDRNEGRALTESDLGEFPTRVLRGLMEKVEHAPA